MVDCSIGAENENIFSAEKTLIIDVDDVKNDVHRVRIDSRNRIVKKICENSENRVWSDAKATGGSFRCFRLIFFFVFDCGRFFECSGLDVCFVSKIIFVLKNIARQVG